VFRCGRSYLHCRIYYILCTADLGGCRLLYHQDLHQTYDDPSSAQLWWSLSNICGCIAELSYFASWVTINAKPLGMITFTTVLSMPNQWAHRDYQCQILGKISTVISIPNHRAQSQRLSIPNTGHDLNCPINAKPLGMIS